MLNNRRGSLLLEALLAIVIMAVGITVIIQSMTAGYRAASQNTAYTQAILLIDQRMMELFAAAPIKEDIHEEGTFPGPVSAFAYTLTAAPLSTDEQSKIDHVSLAVTWNSGIKNNALKVDTYILKKP